LLFVFISWDNSSIAIFFTFGIIFQIIVGCKSCRSDAQHIHFVTVCDLPTKNLACAHFWSRRPWGSGK
jgi:hypothetical protein